MNGGLSVGRQGTVSQHRWMRCLSAVETLGVSTGRPQRNKALEGLFRVQCVASRKIAASLDAMPVGRGNPWRF
ncbi:MAG: hypothetical protein WCJ21_12740, partial [Planctomycetota bacterium]